MLGIRILRYMWGTATNLSRVRCMASTVRGRNQVPHHGILSLYHTRYSGTRLLVPSHGQQRDQLLAFTVHHVAGCATDHTHLESTTYRHINISDIERESRPIIRFIGSRYFDKSCDNSIHRSAIFHYDIHGTIRYDFRHKR